MVDRAAQVTKLSVESDRHCRGGQTGPDRLCHLQPGDPVGMLDDLSVWVTKL
jgi:hypothetical protein